MPQRVWSPPQHIRQHEHRIGQSATALWITDRSLGHEIEQQRIEAVDFVASGVERATIAVVPDLAADMPSALRANARWVQLPRRASGDDQSIPALIVHPDWAPPLSVSQTPLVPLVIWMHGRTVNKELDPGRYLRWMRAGIGTCAVDLPGHGERFDAELQQPTRTFDVVRQMIDEIDDIVAAIADMKVFDMTRLAIGGVSAGGMAALARMCITHPFRCTSVEATTGSWEHQRHRQMFRDVPPTVIEQYDPIRHLDHWRKIPFQAIHAKADEWVSFEGQTEFVEALRKRYRDASLIDFIAYEKTGAPSEHIGFGKLASDAKNRQRDFLKKWLNDDAAN